MATAKTTPLAFRIEPSLKEGLCTAAHEHRSIVNMVEVLIRDHCGHNGITIPEQGELLPGEKRNRIGKDQTNEPYNSQHHR